MAKIKKLKAQQMSEIVSYLTEKWYDIMEQTGLCLSVNNKKWTVMDKNFKTVKKGTFKACMDYVLKKWKGVKNVK